MNSEAHDSITVDGSTAKGPSASAAEGSGNDTEMRDAPPIGDATRDRSTSEAAGNGNAQHQSQSGQSSLSSNQSQSGQSSLSSNHRSQTEGVMSAQQLASKATYALGLSAAIGETSSQKSVSI